MARNIDRRLDSLNKRRLGLDRLGRVTLDQQSEIIRRSMSTEAYQKRAPNRPYTRYALGAMQEVGEESTRVSLTTAERVKGQLKTGLEAVGRLVDFRLQGSVPCNIHIRGVSDVDLLSLDIAFITYDITGPAARQNGYRSPISYTPAEALRTLRVHIERILTDKFPATTVDTAGSKAVKIFGGSLARPVDVVPSHWHDTVDYQRTYAEHDRGVSIFDRAASSTVKNMPFRHIKLITERDLFAALCLKRAIRLCKNVKSDAVEEGTKIPLSSFDIASAMYHADIANLRVSAGYELGVLAETQRHLDHLATDLAYARTLSVPDGSRKIFDDESKLRALRTLSGEMDDLVKEVAKEQAPRSAFQPEFNVYDSRLMVTRSYVPLS